MFCFGNHIDRSNYTKDERIAFYTAVIIDRDLQRFCVHCPLFYRTKSCSICGGVDNLDVHHPAIDSSVNFVTEKYYQILQLHQHFPKNRRLRRAKKKSRKSVYLSERV